MRRIQAGILAAAALCAAGAAFGDDLDGAKWIGAHGNNLPVYTQYLPVFRIDFDFRVAPGKKASLLYGMNDRRLMNRNLNLFNIESPQDSSAMRLEINGDGTVAVYRFGYRPDDNAAVPIATFDAKGALTSGLNHLQLVSNLGYTEVQVNGKSLGNKGLGAVGNGGDFLAYPVLAEMKVEIEPGSDALIKDITVSNMREPGNRLFAIPGAYTSTTRLAVPERSMPQLRSRFAVDGRKKVTSATVTATARGIYDMDINGRRITDGYFYPGSTQYNKTHLYHTFDITPFVTAGDNRVSAQLAEGWWSGPATYVGENWNFFGDRQSLVAKIRIRYDDGTEDVYVTSPQTWEVSTDGPVRTGSFFQGEVYDATVDESGRRWYPATEIAQDSTVCKGIGEWKTDNLLPDYGVTVTAVDTLTAVSMTEPRPGVYVYDFGQNMAGVPLIHFSGLPKGQTVCVRSAEVLYPDMPQYAGHKGMIMTENLRAAMCRDQYIARGAGSETFSPRYTLHGYRYLELTGLDRPLPPQDVKSIVLSSIDGFKAHYECSDTLVNRLWQNIKWSSLSNFISIPTDCPQRNERLGWMGDISVFSPTATKIADVSGLLKQYLQAVRDCQREDGRYPDVAPTGLGFGGLLWGSAGITVPYEHFSQYADTTVLREHYPSMKRYIDYIFRKTMDPATGIIVQNREWGDLADWLSPEYNRTDKSLLWECYLIHDLDIMSDVARILGNGQDAAHYRGLAAERRKFFNKVYVDPKTYRTRFSAFDPGKEGRDVDTQVSYALPIAFGIVDNPKFNENFIKTVTRENVADNGRKCPAYSLMTGFIGTAWIGPALSRIGRSDIAYRLLTNTQYPSWLYPVTQGATTIWERLDSYTHADGFGTNNSMNSFNHYSFGSVGDWLLTHSLGIRKAGNSLVIAPEPDMTGALTRASGWLDLPSGRAESSWRRTADGVYEILVTVPEAATFIDPFTHRPRPLAPGTHRLKAKK